MGNHAQMVSRHWMTPSLSVSLIFLACLSHIWAGAGPFSWGSRINFAKVAKEKVEEDHRAPRSVWAQHFEDDETTIDKGEAVPFQGSTGTVPRSRVADFRRAFTTLG